MYTDQSRVESFLKRELTSYEVEIFDDTVNHISSFIDGYTGRSWLPVTDDAEPESEERIFDGNGKHELFVDDFTTIESIILGDRNGSPITTLEDETEWITYPNNATLKESIRLRNNFFPLGDSNITITAIWGSGDVPIDVVMVATALVGGFLSGMGDTTGKFKSESIEGYSYTLLDGTITDEQTQGYLKRLDKWKKFTL